MAYNGRNYTQARIVSANWRLSSRKDAWAERCTPKTTAAAFDGLAEVIASTSLFRHYFVLNDLIIKYVNGIKTRPIVKGKNQTSRPFVFFIVLYSTSPKIITRMSFK